MDLMELRRALLANQYLLPPIYQRVEYIEGTGTQYIDSGIECTSDLSVDFEFSVSTMVSASFCGGIDTRTPIFRHHGSLYVPSANNKNIYYYSLNEKQIISREIATPQINTRYHVNIDTTNGRYSFTGDNYNESGEFEPLPYMTTGRGYGILGRIAHTGATSLRPSRIYNFKFFRSGKQIGDFIPCYRKSDREPGMYDYITRTFFTNAGTGTIGVGPDI